MRQRNQLSARISRRQYLYRNASFESVEERMLLTGFVAYNGLYSSDITNPNSTFYVDLAGSDSAGPLMDVDTGAVLEARVSTAQQGVTFGGNGSNPAPETDAHEIFDSYVDFTAGSLRSLEIASGDAYTYDFENLNPGASYQFAATAIRGNASYTNRWTLVQIEGADSLTPAHSDNVAVVTDGLATNQVAIWTGGNNSSAHGVVAQWTDIDPGDDGIFTVLSTQYQGAVPTSVHSSGIADGSKGYGLAAVRLIEDVAVGPPIVENSPAENIFAFEAQVGGTVISTGGDVPNITLYWGTTDVGVNAGAWENAVDLGGQSRSYTHFLDGLEPDTTYYYRSFATNNLGAVWAEGTESFSTLPALAPSVQTLPPNTVGAFSAVLNGNVTETGNDIPLVNIYFGDNDGGTDVAAWDQILELGVQSAEFAAAISQLDPVTTYYYRAFAVNAVGASWGPGSQSFATPGIPPIQITELMTDNSRTLTTRTREQPGDLFIGDNLTPDWFEVSNPTDVGVDFGGYSITDNLNRLDKWVIPAGTVIPAGGYRIFFASGLDIQDARLDERAALHTNFTFTDVGGESLALVDGQGTIVSSIDLIPVQSEDISYGVDEVGDERYFPTPTPGESNANDVPKAPVIDTPSQTFVDALTVAIEAGLPTDTIHYTLDERIPTSASPIYTEPITISGTTQLRVIAIGANGKQSTRVGESYIQLSSSVLNRTSNLPLVIVETFGDAVAGKGTTFGDTFIGMIEPDGDLRTSLDQEFDVATRAGFRIRGSSSAGFSKKQYRVEFWDAKDEDRKLETLGMPAEADWVFYGPNQYDRVLISNPLMFDISNQVGRYATRTRWVEMYINRGGTVSTSDYVGLYAITEVVEEDNDRVDVGKLSTGAGGVPVQGGFIWKIDRGSPYVDPDTPTSAQRVYMDRWFRDLQNAAAGPNFKDPELGYARYADVDSFIDHNILNLVPNNVDAFRLSSFYFKQETRDLIEAGPIWDFDRSLDSTDSRDNNPRTWYGGGDSTRFFNDSDRVGSWWSDMFSDPDFVQRYIDRWFELRANELSNENLFETIDKHADEVREAAARDYSRWSGSRYGNFDGEINHLKDWLRLRVEWIDSQWLKAPTPSVAQPAVEAGTEIALSAPNGTIYYTLDGTDPRGFGGAIRPEAQTADGPIVIDDFTQITARIHVPGHGRNQGYTATGDDWSAPLQAEYFINAPATAETVAITEVHYHPADPSSAELAAGFDDADEFEFMEIQNIADFPVALNGAKLGSVDVEGDQQGVEFEFSDGDITLLGPGERVVVVENLDAFRERYGNDVAVAGQWSGGLNNNREMVTLLSFDDSIIRQFEYRDDAGWPIRADGDGSSLIVADIEGDYALATNWTASVEMHGSPGEAAAAPVGIVINEVLSHTDLPQTDAIELLNFSDQAINIGGWYLSDSNDDYLKFEIPAGLMLQPGKYIVYDETDFNPNPLNPGPKDFALSGSRGDDVWLIQTDGAGTITSFVDEVHFNAAPNGESFGRIPNGSGPLAPMREVTLGAMNSAARVGPVLLSEIQYDPGEPSPGAQGLHPRIEANDLEFVEVTNTGLEPVELTNWRIRGGINFDFPAGTLEPGGKRVVVSFDPTDPLQLNLYVAFLVHYGINQSTPLLGPFDGRLNNAGERVTLQRPDEPPLDDPMLIPRLIEDEVIYDDVAPWPEAADGTGDSLQRLGIESFGSDAASWVAANPTPGEFNVAIRGDFNGDQKVDASDIDLLFAAINGGGNPASYDLTGNGEVDKNDADELVRDILGTRYGDVDLDGDIDSADATQMTINWTGALMPLAGDRSWRDGDTDGDGDVDTADLTSLAVNWTGAIDVAMAVVSATRGSRGRFIP